MRHLLDTTDLSLEEVDGIISTAIDIINNKEKYAHVCDGKKLATLFFEPSTRTRLSFEAAMMELGGNVLGFSEAASSSASKGETVEDTVRMVSCYADIIAMRHPLEGAPRVASFKSGVSIINAGDGGHSHPTQTLADLLTIFREKGRLDNMTVGLCGDLKFGRTVHSLIGAAFEKYDLRVLAAKLYYGGSLGCDDTYHLACGKDLLHKGHPAAVGKAHAGRAGDGQIRAAVRQIFGGDFFQKRSALF